MEKPLITICIVNYNSSDFVKFAISALKKLTKNSYKIILRDNNSKIKDFGKLEEYIKEEKNIFLYRVESNLSGSLAHGEALNEIVNRIDTEYGVILDADAMFLVKSWDEILINKMTDSMPIYGTQADDSGVKPMDFPLMFAIFFKTEILKSLEIDFRPVNTSIGLDTGFQMREKYTKAGFNGGLLYSFNTRKNKNGPFADIPCTEYYLEKDGSGDIFACHFGRGSAPKAKKLFRFEGDSHMSRYLNKAFSFINIIIWRRHKKKWLSIARKVINKENV